MVRTWQKKKRIEFPTRECCCLHLRPWDKSKGFPESFKGLGEINRGLSIFRYSTLHMFLM